MKTKRSIILIIVVLILIPMMLAGCKGFLPLSGKRKAEIEDAFMKVAHKELCWWDENGYDRLPGTFRYFDSYGDCIVLLKYINTPCDSFGWPLDPPYALNYLTRPMECPVSVNSVGVEVIFDILLYNTNPNCPKESNNLNCPTNLNTPLASLIDLHKRGLTWLTNEELEQLTTDLENWIAEGNY